MDPFIRRSRSRPRAIAALALLIPLLSAARCGAAPHVWEKQELSFTAAGHFSHPYTDVTIWVDLVGPHFNKRVYGFWDGGNQFLVRLVANEPGEWRWTSGSDPEDKGLSGKSGSFTAVPWSEDEKRANSLRRGFFAGHPEWPRPATCRWHALLRCRGHLVLGGDESLQVVRR